MNILCKIFGHNMWFNTNDVLGPSHCKKWFCNHKEKAIEFNFIPIPKCKPPKKQRTEY